MFLKPYTLRNILRKFNFKSRSQPAMVIVKYMWGLRSATMFRSPASKLQYLSLGCSRIRPQILSPNGPGRLHLSSCHSSQILVEWLSSVLPTRHCTTSEPSLHLSPNISEVEGEEHVRGGTVEPLQRKHKRCCRGGWGWVWGLYSYHRNIHLVPATTTTTTLLQLRGLRTRYWQLKQEF